MQVFHGQGCGGCSSCTFHRQSNIHPHTPVPGLPSPPKRRHQCLRLNLNPTMVTFRSRCHMQHDASVPYGGMESQAFVFLSWKADDHFTISDYQLVWLVLEGLHQHCRQEYEIAHPCLGRHVGNIASFLVWLRYSSTRIRTPFPRFTLDAVLSASSLQLSQTRSRRDTPGRCRSRCDTPGSCRSRTELDDDLVGVFSRCLGNLRFHHLHNDCLVEENRSNSQCIRLRFRNAISTHFCYLAVACPYQITWEDMFYFLDGKTPPGFCHGSENLCKVLQIRSFFINASFPLDAVGFLSVVRSGSLFFFKFSQLSWFYR